MDFIKRIPMIVMKRDFIMVVVDNLSKLAHFIPIKSTHNTSNIENIFMREIFRLHGLPREDIPSSPIIFGGVCSKT